jgi:septal ring factor EnvC (AmiA/AmiB activator)
LRTSELESELSARDAELRTLKRDQARLEKELASTQSDRDRRESKLRDLQSALAERDERIKSLATQLRAATPRGTLRPTPPPRDPRSDSRDARLNGISPVAAKKLRR